jgi:hypothetical protein
MSKACNADLLILNHISPKSESDLSALVEEAYDASDHGSSVLVSFDFLEVVVPWMGFGRNGAEGSSEIAPSESTRVEPAESDVRQWVRGIFQ